MKLISANHSHFLRVILASLLASITACQDSSNISQTAAPVSMTKSTGPGESFNASNASLAEHTAVPDWFRDAKLGIYFHWGVYSVPAKTSEWYPRHMHFDLADKLSPPQGHRISGFADLKPWHEENFGPLEEFGYHDFVPLFTAENFDADEWADLFIEAGARFAGPVAEHHDGFSMWDSDITPWNAADRGPKRDITGELFEALRARGLKTIATFHHARNLQRYRGMTPEQAAATRIKVRKGESRQEYIVYHNSHYPWIEGQPPTSDDPDLRLLYGNVPEEEWLETIWYGKLMEVVEKYQPDIIWFDTWLRDIPELYRLRFAANYLNSARSWDREVIIASKHQTLDPAWALEDIEKGRRSELTEDPWLTDDTISTGSWSFTDRLKVKPVKRVVHDFIDIVSKNGQLLLNISPRADGSIPDDQRAVLGELGAWLRTNKEAIYGSRPWHVYGEGPTRQTSNGHFMAAIDYSPEDIRFTTGNENLYAITMGKPTSPLLIKSFSGERIFDLDSATIVGQSTEVRWQQTELGLELYFDELPDGLAYTFRLSPKESIK